MLNKCTSLGNFVLLILLFHLHAIVYPLLLLTVISRGLSLQTYHTNIPYPHFTSYSVYVQQPHTWLILTNYTTPSELPSSKTLFWHSSRRLLPIFDTFNAFFKGIVFNWQLSLSYWAICCGAGVDIQGYPRSFSGTPKNEVKELVMPCCGAGACLHYFWGTLLILFHLQAYVYPIIPSYSKLHCQVVSHVITWSSTSSIPHQYALPPPYFILSRSPAATPTTPHTHTHD